MTKIAIIGGTITGNQGANAMLQTVLQTLKYDSNTKFTVFSYYPKDDKKANKNKNVKIVSATPLRLLLMTLPLTILYSILRKIRMPSSFIKRNEGIKELLEADLLIDIAGVSFIDGREIYLPFNIACILPAILLKTKTIKYSQAMGPFKNFINRNISKIILPRINHIIARGEKTLENLNSLKLKNATMLPESSFSLRLEEKTKEKVYKLRSKKIFKKRTVGISPSSVVDSYCRKNKIDYVKIMAEFICHLNKNDYNVLLIPHSYRIGKKAEKNNDLVVCNKILELAEQSGCELLGEGMDPQELRVLIGMTDFFIAARFHAMISALAAKVPVLVCGWSHKYKEVLKMFDMEEYCFDYKRLDTNKLITEFDKMARSEKELQAKYEKYLKKVIEGSDEHIKLVKNLLKA